MCFYLDPFSVICPCCIPILSLEYFGESQQNEKGISSSNPIDVKETMSLLHSALRTADANKHIGGSERDM